MAEANINLIGSEDMPSPSQSGLKVLTNLWPDVVACFLSMFPHGTETVTIFRIMVRRWRVEEMMFPLSQSPFYYFMDRSQ